MKYRTLLVLIFAVLVGALRADFFSPFADSKVGTTVTAEGQIIVIERKGGGADYFVRCRTDTGPRVIPAEIPPRLVQPEMAGHDAKITATIGERDDAQSGTKTRILAVTEIQIKK